MSVLKLWLPRPRRVDRTRLPATLALLLVLLVVAQVATVPEVAAPAAPSVSRTLALSSIIIPKVAIPAEIVARNVFSAGRGLGTEGAEQVPGVVAVGIVRDRGAARAFIALPGGKLRTMRIGDVNDGWRLIAIASDSVVFARGETTARLGLSAGKPPETVEEGVDQ